LGGPGAREANRRRATHERRKAEDEARLAELAELRGGDHRLPGHRREPVKKLKVKHKSAAATAVASFNAAAAPAAEAAVSSGTGRTKRKQSTPHKSAGGQALSKGASGEARAASKGAGGGARALSYNLPEPSNGLEYTPASAVKILAKERKPGPAAHDMIARRRVPVQYSTLLNHRSKHINDPSYKPP
jgi:hypothetical protein